MGGSVTSGLGVLPTHVVAAVRTEGPVKGYSGDFRVANCPGPLGMGEEEVVVYTPPENESAAAAA